MNKVLDEAVLRRLAGPRAFERGTRYLKEGRVKSIVKRDDEIRGKVQGQRTYAVRLRLEDGGLVYWCNCPMGADGDCCKHCVAVGLAWLNRDAPGGVSRAAGRRSKAATTMDDVRTYLATQKVPALVNLLMEQAEGNESLQRQLLMLAAKNSRNGPDLATYRQAIDDTLRADSYAPFEELYDYADKIDEVLDSIGDLLKDGHSAIVVDLAEHALRTLEETMESVGDPDGGMKDAIGRLEDLHHAACKKAKPDPVGLAKRLFDWELHGEWDTFFGASKRYVGVLGTKGLDAYRRLAEECWARVPHLVPDRRDYSADRSRFRITQIMESLAHSTGSVEALVAIKARDLSSSWSYLQIAETYRNAKKGNLALEWAERGVEAFPKDRDTRLAEFLATEYHRRKRHDDAMKVVWPIFEAMPSVHEYGKLKSHANKAKQWPLWREKAIELVRDRIRRAARNDRSTMSDGVDNSTLVGIFLWEKDFETAWREAKLYGCRDVLWRELAAWREKDHPEDAVPIYWKVVRSLLAWMGNDAYAKAVDLLRRIRPLMRRYGKDEEFLQQLAALRAKHKAKRNFVKLLDQAKWT